MSLSPSSLWRGVAVLALAVLATTPSSLAADRLPADVFAGYSFMKLEGVDRRGVNLAVSFSLAGVFSGFVDSSAHWGSEGLHGWIHRNDLTLMAGPGVPSQPGGTTSSSCWVGPGQSEHRWNPWSSRQVAGRSG